jgi:hypothetical protein
MEFNYDFAGKLLAAILLLLVVSDQLTTPAADPRDGDANEAQPPFKPYGPDGSGIDLRAAALEEASLLLKLAERAIPYAKAPLVQAAAALGVEPSDTPQMDLSPSRRRPRRAARFAADSDAGSDASSESSSAEAAAIARRSVHYEVADARCQPTLHAGFSGGALNWGMSFKVETDGAGVLRRLPRARCKVHRPSDGGAGLRDAPLGEAADRRALSRDDDIERGK